LGSNVAVSFLFVSALTLMVCYPLAVVSGRVTSEDFFISSSIDEHLEHCVGGLGLALAGQMLVAMGCIRHAYVKKHDSTRRVGKLNQFALFCTFVSSFGFAGVGAFNASGPAGFGVHLSFAALAFLPVVVFMGINNYIDRYIDYPSPRYVHWIRMANFWLAILGFLGMFIFITMCLPLSASFELLMAAQILVYIASLGLDFRHISVSLHIESGKTLLGDFDHSNLISQRGSNC